MVDTEEKLAAYLPILRSAPWVAVDTEADSLHAYPEKVCLIQISTPEGDRIIDPLAAINIDPLLDAVAGHELIMHGADYDLRLLRKHHEFVPGAIFDTMLAARLIGIRQFGLGDLVRTYLGVTLEKGPQKANWAIRPLSERMENYARNDTRYLRPLADKLRGELERLGRLEWHQESCARLIEDCSQPPPENPDVWRVKGSNKLTRPAMAVLRELWHWREREAVGANKPPFFVLSHDLLMKLAQTAADQQNGQVEELLPRHLSERRRGGIKKAIEQGLAVSPPQQPSPIRNVTRRPNEAELRRFTELQNRRDKRAAELGIDPTLIAPRAMLSELAHSWEKTSPTLMRWQRQLLS